MDTIIANASQLNQVLLDTDEDEYDSLATQVLSALKKLTTNDPKKILEASGTGIRKRTQLTTKQILQRIDPAILTIPYIYLLSALVDAASSSKSSRSISQALLPEGQAWPAIAQGLLTFDPIQMRYLGPQLTKIVEIVYAGAQQTGNLVPAIQLLQNVILRLDPSSSTLTLTHFYFVQCCVQARAYAEATTILDLPVYHIPTAESTRTLEKRLSKHVCSTQESTIAYINPQSGLSGKITSRMFLEYYLLGALCYIGNIQWKKAQAMLEVILVTPTISNVASLIQVEAYKKWLLISLIVDGDSHQAPRAINGNALKLMRSLAKPYECLVDAFKTHSLDTLTDEVKEGIEVWTADANYGLVWEVVAVFMKFAVIRLSKTFAALPIEEVAQRTSPNPQDVQDCLKYVQDLINAGEIQAQITPSQSGSLGTVRFLAPVAAQKNEAQIEAELIRKSAELKVFFKHISDYDHQLEVNKDYLEWLQKAKKARDQEKKNGSGVSSKPFGIAPPGAADIDEEMMDDMPY